ncbi:hypothetical protein DL98DRAFT_514004 [Cadophora sp. DSE1049]|nr:hypothetical protein DL98DRAFT_514004 [Cadophora sp. DSE1049]
MVWAWRCFLLSVQALLSRCSDACSDRSVCLFLHQMAFLSLPKEAQSARCMLSLSYRTDRIDSSAQSIHTDEPPK